MFTTRVCHTALVLASVISIGLCIKCFQCNSAEHEECKDLTVNDTNSEFYRECNGDYGEHKPFCRKIATEVVDIKNSKRTIRTCGWTLTNDKGDYCKKSDSDFLKKKSCQCFTDACNSSERIGISIKLPIIINVVFSSLLYFVYRL